MTKNFYSEYKEISNLEYEQMLETRETVHKRIDELNKENRSLKMKLLFLDVEINKFRNRKER